MEDAVAKEIRIICMSMRCDVSKTLAAVESLSACATHLLHIVINQKSQARKDG